MNEKQLEQQGDKYTVRFPPGLRNDIKVKASQSHRTMNAEILFLIEQGRKAVYGEQTTAH